MSQPNSNSDKKLLFQIDHVAFATVDIAVSISFFVEKLGFSLKEQRFTEGIRSGMESAVLVKGDTQIVLLQGTNKESQIAQFVHQHGPGVHHIAIRVESLSETVAALRGSNLLFATSEIQGEGLSQIFTVRNADCGVMLEFVQRTTDGFESQNVAQLFKQLEANGLT